MHEAIQDARSNSGCARILHCFMHLGMLEAISIRMEIVSGNFRCLSISNCGFPAPDAGVMRVSADYAPACLSAATFLYSRYVYIQAAQASS